MSAPRRAASRLPLVDCAQHGPGSGAELFVVEGDSAAQSVAAVRSARTQAVLALQGKPLNAWRASPAKVDAHLFYRQLADALGAPSPTRLAPDAESLRTLRFERVCLLFDPDADGIHIGALAMLYLRRFAPALVAAGGLVRVRAPMAAVAVQRDPAEAAEGVLESLHVADTPAELQALRAQFEPARARGAQLDVVVHRGLGSIAPARLAQWCVDPATRRAQVVTERELQVVAEVFGRAGSS